MPELVFTILGALIAIGGGGNHIAVEEASGYSYPSIYLIAPSMVRHGVIGQKWGRYWITERGKIAWAIESVRRQRKMANGTFRMRAISAKAYMHATQLPNLTNGAI